jgi:hypothetical protein
METKQNVQAAKELYRKIETIADLATSVVRGISGGGTNVVGGGSTGGLHPTGAIYLGRPRTES